MSLTHQSSRLSQYDSMLAAQQELANVIQSVFTGANGETYGAPAFGVDVREDKDQVILDIDLPGFTKDQIEITLENATLSIVAERPNTNPQANANGEENGMTWLLRERRTGRFARSFKFPPSLDGGTVDAKLADGVLTVTLKKREESKPRKVQVM